MTRYKLGLIITILGWLFSLVGYWIIFSGPVFLIGIFVVWNCKVSIKQKLLTTIIPLLLWYPSALGFDLLTRKYATPQTFLIPQDFRGKITIVYNEQCGEMVPKVHGRLVYRIPMNGIMIIKNESETGYIDDKYYFVDNDWNKVSEITEFIQQDFNEEYTTELNKHEPPRDKVGVFFLGFGAASISKNKGYEYTVMNVNSWNGFKTQYNLMGPDYMVDSLLNECRQRSNAHHSK